MPYQFCLVVFNLEWENRERENLNQPVHILILVSIDDSTIFQPADGRFGYARGLAGQSGLNVDCNRHIDAAIGDGRGDWKMRTRKLVGAWGAWQNLSASKAHLYSSTHRILVDPPSYVASLPDLLPCTGIGQCRSPEQSGCVTTHPQRKCTCTQL